MALVPGIDSVVWWPARAILGDLTALAAVGALGLLLLDGAIVMFSARFGDHAIAAASIAEGGTRRQRRCMRSGSRPPSRRCGARNGRCCGAIRG